MLVAWIRRGARRKAEHARLDRVISDTVKACMRESAAVIQTCRDLTRPTPALTERERIVLDAAACNEGIDCPHLRGAGIDRERVREMADYLRETKPEACREYEAPRQRQKDHP